MSSESTAELRSWSLGTGPLPCHPWPGRALEQPLQPGPSFTAALAADELRPDPLAVLFEPKKGSSEVSASPNALS